MDLSLSAWSDLNNQMMWSGDARAQQQHMVSNGAAMRNLIITDLSLRKVIGTGINTT